MIKPENFDLWNPAMRGAFIKGYKCAESGGSAAYGCPYIDKRKPSGRISWSRAFIHAWHDGFSHFHYTKV